jgi:tetratricopeptide (TPR) repeat protein
MMGDGTGSKMKYPNHLRLWIERRNYKVKPLADQARIPVRTLWEYIGERAVIDPDRLVVLAEVLQCSPEQLLFGDRHDAEREEMERRQALQMQGKTGSVPVFPSAHSHFKELETLFTRKIARLQRWVIDGIEDGTRLRWQLYYTSNNRLTEDGLISQIERLEALAGEGGSQYQRVCRILAQNYQLAGSLARDAFNYSKARDYFQKVEQLGDDIQLPDLVATAVARRGLALLRRGKGEDLREGLELYRNAAKIAKWAEPYTRAYVLSGFAEALARNGYRSACYRVLDQAEQFLDKASSVPLEEDFAFVRLTLQSLEDSRGECYVLLGEAEKGLGYLLTAQEKVDQKLSRNYCRLIMQQSEAYLVAGHPDSCVQQALKGLEIARAIESTSSMYWVEEIHTKLLQSAWKQETVVSKLGAALKD